jgi:A/G-specific adenine glycosylase
MQHAMEPADFAARVIGWQRTAGRHDLPWQGTRDPYHVWISEIMLQQTQVATVIPYYERFIGRFPDLSRLADADEDAVLQLWSGLGYYARARNLHRAAQAIRDEYRGRFPQERDAIEGLPGIGRSTANAIAVFAFGQRHPILDGNVKRVLARCFAIEGFPGIRGVEDRLWKLAEQLLAQTDVEAYTQGLMDLGAGICIRGQAKCDLCPLAGTCIAKRQQRVTALPSQRPRKALPERSTVMLVLRRRGDVLLEKRPGHGIWGGLWSFPEVEDVRQAHEAALHRFGVHTAEAARLEPLRHGFTHFSLTITPALLQVSRIVPQARETGAQWLSIEEAMAAAVPAPVRTILKRLREGRR